MKCYNSMYKLYYIFIVFLLSIPYGNIFASTGEVLSSENIQCNDIFQIDGSSQVRVDSTHEFQILPTASGANDFTGKIIYTLYRGNKMVETVSDRDKYLRYFTTPWTVLLEARVENEANNCQWILQKEIRVYNNFLTYIGIERPGIDEWIREMLEKQDILYRSHILKVNLSQSDNVLEIWGNIEKSDIFIVGNSDILGFFSDIVKLQKSKQVNFSKKRVYIISDFSRSFLSKIIASPLSQIGATKVFLISNDQFYGLLTRIGSGDANIHEIWQELSYEKSKTIYSLSGFLEFLTYSGFSYQLIAFLLSLTFVVLMLNVLKQIVGLNVFWIYYPILFAITLSILGYSTLIFVGIWFISLLLVNIFSKQVHLLIHAKRALLISLYIALFLFILGIDNYFELSIINYSVFDNPYIIFPLFIAIILADKIFQEEINVFSGIGMIDLLQYGIVTGIIYGCMEFKTLQYFLISFPDVIILVIFLNIIIGRYMWLQLFEYFRFSPLLRKLNEEE